MFGKLLDLGRDIVDVIKAPVEITVDLTRATIKPLAEAAREVVKETKEMVSEDSDEE